MPVVLRQKWVEKSRGRGEGDESFSLHRDMESRNAFIAIEMAGREFLVPDEYDVPAGEPTKFVVSEVEWAAITRTPGQGVWQQTLVRTPPHATKLKRPTILKTAHPRKGCSECEHKGWLFCAPDHAGEDEHDWVSRCDTCQTYASDEEAAVQAAGELGRGLMWGLPGFPDLVIPEFEDVPDLVTTCGLCGGDGCAAPQGCEGSGVCQVYPHPFLLRGKLGIR